MVGTEPFTPLRRTCRRGPPTEDTSSGRMARARRSLSQMDLGRRGSEWADVLRVGCSPPGRFCLLPARLNPDDVNKEEPRNLRLKNQELEDVVAFLQTLTDGWGPSSSR